MKTKKEMLNQMARKITQKMIRADSEGWPPDSALGFYQPMRPRKQITYDTKILEDAISQCQPSKN